MPCTNKKRMMAKHPDIAKKWMAKYGKAKSGNKYSSALMGAK